MHSLREFISCNFIFSKSNDFYKKFNIESENKRNPGKAWIFPLSASVIQH